jgi:hypothetical protein
MEKGPFRPGELVPATGIYGVTHYQHRMPHEVFARQGDVFPNCRRCYSRVSFRLVQPAAHLGADPDFFTSSEEARSKRARAGGKKTP